MLDKTITTEAFVKTIEDYSKEIQQASLFESDLVTNVNPSSKTVNKMFAWDIEPHCKISHDSMKRVFCKLGNIFNCFLSMLANVGARPRLTNSKSRCFNLCVDQLSSQKFRCLKLMLSLLESLARVTCTIDYLHETRTHHNKAIH